MTPDLIASSRVRYSLTETFSLAARRVKKKLINMTAGDSAGSRRQHSAEGRHVPRRGIRPGFGLAAAAAGPASRHTSRPTPNEEPLHVSAHQRHGGRFRSRD